mmetsp:Transcript_23608/g.54183  ORF Transcript_23608/g.54183 Transcript_23608/m.54183 type:complete len:199 (-) Transcript_23608:1472-2068(-)
MQTLTRRIYKEGLKASALLQQQHKLMEFRRTLTSMPKYLPQHLPSAFANSSHWSKLAGATLVGCGIGQYYYGNQKDFYDYRFITDKDPDDLASFYGSESFMDLFCVIPLMGTLMMRGGYFDDEGTVHTTGLPGEMLVRFRSSRRCRLASKAGSNNWIRYSYRFPWCFPMRMTMMAPPSGSISAKDFEMCFWVSPVGIW